MIAIHNSPFGFHPRWAAYCEKNNIPFKRVNCYVNDLITEIKGCDSLMWHHNQNNPKDLIIAKPILYALEQAGIRVFPDFRSNWHFDDKAGQKYLLEATEVPFVPSYLFFEKVEALKWVASTSYPKVFKLRGGAGSDNVRLVSSHDQAKKLINIAFGKGFSNYDPWSSLKERWRKFKVGKTNLMDVIKGIVRFGMYPEYAKIGGRQRGYIYFQDFIPDNQFDIRVVVIGDKAFALKRMVRKNDFRASGGGEIVYRKEEIDERCVQIAFQANEKIQSQSIAYDFVFNEKNEPLIVEISYGYAEAAYDYCEGYWTQNMQWHPGTHFDFCGWMVEDLLK
jgi:glutathione synthase/RimK-type ligase-like ATP-grasp enzyme